VLASLDLGVSGAQAAELLWITILDPLRLNDGRLLRLAIDPFLAREERSPLSQRRALERLHFPTGRLKVEG
jgi:hypothetical protein